MAIARRVGGFTPAQADDLRKAISKKNKELMATLKEPLMQGLRRQRRAAGRGPAAVGELRGHRRLLVQQEPRRLLRAHQLPHRLAQGQLPGRVHGGAHLQRHEHQGQGALLREPVPRDGHRGAAAGRQRERRRLHRGGGQDPLRPERREGRGDAAPSRRSSRRAPPARSPRSTTSAAASTRRSSTSARSRRSSRAAPSTAPATRGAACSRRCRGHGRRRAAAQGRRRRAREASSTPSRRTTGCRSPASGAAARVRPGDAAARARRRRWASMCRPTRSRACASSSATRSMSSSPRSTTRADGSVLWTGGIIANAQKKVSKNGGVWLAFRLEDVDGGVECRAWPATYEQYRDLLVEDAIVKVKGRVERKAEAETTLIAMEVQPFSGVSEYRPLTRHHRRRRVRPTRARRPAARSSPTSPARCRWCCTWCATTSGRGCASATTCASRPVAGLYAELKALLGESCIGVG